jgi:serine/threonine-protein kinase
MGTTPVSDPLLGFDSEEDLHPRPWPPAAAAPKVTAPQVSFASESSALFEEERREADDLTERPAVAALVARVLAMAAILATVGVASWFAFFRSAQPAPSENGSSATADVELPRTAPSGTASAPGAPVQPPNVVATSGEASIATPPSSQDAAAQTARRAASRAAAPAASNRIAPPASEAGPVGGWLSVASPMNLEIREDGSLLGVTTVPRVMLPVGRHQIELSSRILGYREVRTVDVSPGRVTSLKVVVPNGRLNVNALPWADVSIDGQNVGQTPLANISLPLGNHEVVLRNPEFGERRQTVVVTLHGVTRVGVDFSKQ